MLKIYQKELLIYFISSCKFLGSRFELKYFKIWKNDHYTTLNVSDYLRKVSNVDLFLIPSSTLPILGV